MRTTTAIADTLKGAAFWRRPKTDTPIMGGPKSVILRRRPKTDAPTEEIPALPVEPGKRTPGATELSMRYAHRNLIVNQEGTWAFYALDGVDWTLRSQEARLGIITDQMFRWADQIGHKIWLRGLSNPYPHQAYARRMYEDNPTRLPATGDGDSAFEDLVTATQHHMMRLDARRSVAVLGVLISPHKVGEEDLHLILSGESMHTRQGETDKVRVAYQRVTASIARPGFEGKPLNARSLRWIVHASLGLGAPVPATLLTGDATGWGDDDIPGFTNPVYASESPYAPTTVLRTMRESKQHTSHVAVLHAAQFDDRNLDREDLFPFLAWLGAQTNPVDYCIVADVVDGRDLKRQAELDRKKGRNVEAHHEEHGDDVPAQALRGIIRAKQVEDEIQNSTREVACRLRGVVMVAVTGPTEEATVQAAADLTSSASREQGFALVHDYGQYLYYRAFTPGEPCPMSGHVRQLPAYFLAAGVPNVSASAGDPTGLLLGNIAGSSDVMVYNPHGGALRSRSNLQVIGAVPGHGKSYLLGRLAAYTALCGDKTVLLDPSGPFARLCDVPYLKPYARHLNLTSASHGILCPSIMVPEPRRADYETDADHKLAAASAAMERAALMGDTMRDLLPYAMVAHDQTGDVQAAIEEACSMVGGGYGADPWEVIARLREMGDSTRGPIIANRLAVAAGWPTGVLIFPDRDVDDAAADKELDQATLTVMTMEGLVLPPDDQPDRSMWSSDALASVPVLNLAARLAMRTIYSDYTSRKAVFLDELGLSLSSASAFTSMMQRAAADSRKRNALVSLVFQNPEMLARLGDQISNLIGSAIIGRLEDEDTAIAALKLLRLKENSGHHQVLQHLEQGEFVVSDWGKNIRGADGKSRIAKPRTRRVLVDDGWWDQALRDALGTNPGGAGSYDEDEGDLIYSAQSGLVTA